MPSLSELFDRIVQRDPEHEDAHELTPTAREHIRHNSAIFMGAKGLQNIADQGAKASTVLPWAMAATGAPTWMLGLLVPIRESGSMLPQAALQPWVLRKPRRARVWVSGAIGEALGATVIALSVAFLDGALAGALILAGLAFLALSRSLTSIASKDIQGRIMPKGMRGRATGVSTMISGVVAVTVGLAIRVFAGADVSRVALALIIGGAAVSWALAAALFSRLREGDEQAQNSADTDFHWVRDSLALLKDDAPFRRFVIVRSLLLVSALAPPFVVALSAERSGAGMNSIATFIIASGVAALLGGRVSGVISDRSSRNTMVFGAALASALVVLFVGSAFIEPLITAWWWGPLVFFLLTLVHTGVRVGRKTYVVDMAEGDQRTHYVAVANTTLGVVLLGVGGISAVLAEFGHLVALVFLALLGLLGVLVGRTLPEVSVERE
ncbi:MAG: MFS transporter [Bowdeniella nasicola]|nr:MFS transporter [Bowdeniella nasicola]